MKNLNDFKNENKDLGKLEMANAFGGLADPKVTKTITAENDSNWNCGDVQTCTTTAIDAANSITVCKTDPLPDGTIIQG